MYTYVVYQILNNANDIRLSLIACAPNIHCLRMVVKKTRPGHLISKMVILKVFVLVLMLLSPDFQLML